MSRSSRKCAACMARCPERLVVLGVRGWWSGYETGDIACWETVWNDYARELGAERAKSTVSELAGLIRTLRHASNRPLTCYPRPCRFLCRDECMALGLIAGCQREAWKAADIAARALAGSEGANAALHSARSYAKALAEVGQVLQPVSLSALAALEQRPADGTLH